MIVKIFKVLSHVSFFIGLAGLPAITISPLEETLGNNRTCANKRSATDIHSRKDSHIFSDPTIRAYNYWSIFRLLRVLSIRSWLALTKATLADAKFLFLSKDQASFLLWFLIEQIPG